MFMLMVVISLLLSMSVTMSVSMSVTFFSMPMTMPVTMAMPALSASIVEKSVGVKHDLVNDEDEGVAGEHEEVRKRERFLLLRDNVGVVELDFIVVITNCFG